MLLAVPVVNVDAHHTQYGVRMPPHVGEGTAFSRVPSPSPHGRSRHAHRGGSDLSEAARGIAAHRSFNAADSASSCSLLSNNGWRLKSGMINIKGRRCNSAGCQHRPGFAMPGEKRGKFCATHREPGMVDVVR